MMLATTLLGSLAPTSSVIAPSSEAPPATPAKRDPKPVSDTAKAEATPHPTATTEYVLLSADRWVYTEPRSDAPRFRFEKRLPAMRRRIEPGPFGMEISPLPRRVLAFAFAEQLPSGFVRVRPVDGNRHHVSLCDFEHPGSRLEVDLYVRSAALLPVVAKEWTRRGEDGTEVTLAPGVALRPIDSRNLQAETPYTSIRIPKADIDTATRFVPSPRYSIQKADHWVKGPLNMRAAGLSVTVHGIGIGLDDVEGPDANAIMTDQGTCTIVKGRGKARYGRPGPSSGYGVVGMMKGTSARIGEGTTVYWPSGVVAGKTRATFVFHREDGKGTIKDGRRCWTSKAFFGEPAQTLCFDVEDVEPGSP